MSSSNIGRAKVIAQILKQEPDMTEEKLSCVPNKALLRRASKPKSTASTAKAS